MWERHSIVRIAITVGMNGRLPSSKLPITLRQVVRVAGATTGHAQTTNRLPRAVHRSVACCVQGVQSNQWGWHPKEWLP